MINYYETNTEWDQESIYFTAPTKKVNVSICYTDDWVNYFSIQ